jgi:hypothetical protein
MTDDGDADLFLLIKPNGNKSEPGLVSSTTLCSVK